MNRLDNAHRARIVRSLVEGNSIRATCRLTGSAKGTVLKLLVEVGEACSRYQDESFRNLNCKRLQLDEIWSFVGAKQKNVAPENSGSQGDVWTWTAIDADTKLIPSWLVGRRDFAAAQQFVRDVESRLANRVQLTTDGLTTYLSVVESAFGYNGIDFGQIVKRYVDNGGAAGRYSPGVCTGADKHVIMGNPDPKHISTSYAERANLTMRMQMRRFTRLTNAFSKKVENHAAAVSLHFAWYNLGRPHQTLTKAAGGIHTTPAMAAGVADHVWTAEEIVKLLEFYAK